MARRGSGAPLRPDDPGEAGAPLYTPQVMEKMDARFRAQMLAAIQAGTEHCATSVSTFPGTKRPVFLRKPD